MTDAYQLVDQQRAQLAMLDRIATGQMETVYRNLLGQAHSDLAAFNTKLASWQAQHPSMDPHGASPSRHWVFQQERYQQLINQLDSNLAFYASTSTKAIARSQEAAMRQAQANQEALTRATMGGDDKAHGALSFAVLPEEAIAAVVGFASDGTPLDTLLRARSADAATHAKNALVDGVAFGRSPQQVASALDASLNQHHWQNLRLARTEMMRAYREAQRMDMLANSSIISGWRWSSAADRRTCPMCMSQHGKVFPIDHVKPGQVSPDAAQHKGLGAAMSKRPVDTASVR